MELSFEDQSKVNAAIAEAERATTGEIFVVFARQSGSYGEVPLAWGAAVAMLAPLLLASIGQPPWEFVGLETAEMSSEMIVLAYAASQFVLFFLTAAIVAIRPVRFALAPQPMKRARVHKRAVEMFMSKGLHLTENRTGVLIFASAADRHGEIIADEAIRRHLGSERWQDASDALDKAMRRRHPTEGLIEAVRFAGAALSEHFPAKPGDVNELPDEVVLI